MNGKREIGQICLEELSEEAQKEVKALIKDKMEKHDWQYIVTIPQDFKDRVAAFITVSHYMLKKIHDRWIWNKNHSYKTDAEHEFKNGMEQLAGVLEYYMNCKMMRDDTTFEPDMDELSARVETASEQLKNSLRLLEMERGDNE